MSLDPMCGGERALLRRATGDVANPLDVKNPDAHATDAIFDIYGRLQAEGSVHWNGEVGDRGFWAVVGYDEVNEVVRQPELFSSSYENGGVRIFDVQDVTATPARMLLMLDPPEQHDLRKAIAPFFTPEHVAAQEPRIRERAERLVSAVAGRGHAELIRDIAAPYTIGLTTDLLGLPEEFGPTLAQWIEVMLGDDDRDMQPSIEVRRKVVAQLDDFAMNLFTRKKKSDSGLINAMLDVTVGGRPLDFNDFSVNLISLSAAFTDTTKHSIAFAVLALDQFPDQRQMLIDRPDLIPLAVKEIIRWATPLMHVRRTALADTTLGGCDIRKGDKVVVWYSAANRDRCRWQDPQNLEVMRFAQKGVSPSMAFGAGAHFCLGWRFAELEMAVMIETLLRTVPDIRPAGTANRMRSNFIRGVKSLDVSFTPAG